MTLLASDVGFYLPQRLGEDDDDGGEMTYNPLVEGEEVNLFDGLDDIAEIYGEVSIRLVYAAVTTANTDRLFGPHFIVARKPAHPSINILIGYPGQWGARRSQIAEQISRYLVKGPRYLGFLWEQQSEGTRGILIFQSPNNPIPAAGDALYLVDREGTAEEKSEFVRVLRVDNVVRDFTAENRTYERLIVVLEISAPLENSYYGATISYLDSLSPYSIIRTTLVSDAVRFYGCKALTELASNGSLQLKTDNVYASIIPASNREIAVSNIDGSPFRAMLIQSGPARSWGAVIAIRAQLGHAIMPLSVKISGWVTLSDTGMGTATDGTVTARIDYAEGFITFPYLAPWEVTAAPAAQLTGPAYTYSIQVTPGNRGYVWTSLLPAGGPVAKGTLTFDYRALDKWYRIQDRGDGSLISEGAGSGTIVSDTAIVTTSALPDIGSHVIFTWNAPIFYDRQDTAIVDNSLYTLNIEPGAHNVVVQWTAGGQQRTATASSEGVFSGDASGFIRKSEGIAYLIPNSIPSPGTSFSISYRHVFAIYQTSQSGVIPLTILGNTISGSFPPEILPIDAGTISLIFSIKLAAGTISTNKDLLLRDTSGVFTHPYVQSGSVNYNTGAFSIILKEYISDILMAVSNPSVSYQVYPLYYANARLSPLGTEARFSAAKSEQFITKTKTLPVGDIQITLAPDSIGALVPGSEFVAGGERYWDKDGILYKNQNIENGTATQVGIVNYQSHVVTITSPPESLLTSVSVKSCLISKCEIPIYQVTSRLIQTPLKVGLTQLQATTMDGRSLSAQDDGNGAILGAEVLGTLDYQRGNYMLRFGKKVLASGLTSQEKAEPWYDDDLIDEDGKIWKPTSVIPNSIKLATVGYAFIPLSKDILKLDPVRLPIDGRIPIIRAGDIAVVHETQETTASPTPGQTVSLRPRIARVRVRCAAGIVPATHYSVNLVTGVLTCVSVTNYATPWIIAHTIEDSAVVVDATVDGRITLSQALTHEFPADSSWISTALVATQDLYARVSIPFTQKTWLSHWKDVLEGDSTLWSYDTTNYPIQVSNVGVRQERWAIIFEAGGATFRCVGERTGQIGSGLSKNMDYSPINPATQNIPGGPYPYFTILAAGWGGGQASGDVFRFNTYAANYPIAVIRSTLPGPGVGEPQDFQLQIRWNVPE